VGITDHDARSVCAGRSSGRLTIPRSGAADPGASSFTIRAFKHLLLFRIEPPSDAPPPKVLSLKQAMGAARGMGAFVVVRTSIRSGSDSGGIGWSRWQAFGIDGFELLNPYHGTDANVAPPERQPRVGGLVAGRSEATNEATPPPADPGLAAAAVITPSERAGPATIEATCDSAG